MPPRSAPVLETIDTEDNAQRVSTGRLPEAEALRAGIDEAYARFRSVADGEVPAYYPALAEVDPDLFGIAVVGTHGRGLTKGDADAPFTIMSIAKPFVLALVLEASGAEMVRTHVGVNATGFPFNSSVPIELDQGSLTNPMVNAGAIATTSMVTGSTLDDRWERVASCLSRFAGRTLALDEAIYASASESNHRNRGLANLLYAQGRLYADPVETVELYTRQSSLSVTAIDLATMGATLANGGVNPVTRERVVSRAVCRRVLAVMATAGLYETSGDWLYEVGLPAKSGVGGGIVTVSPGKGSLATFSPPLDTAGNSVRGQLVARYLAHRLGLDVLASDVEPTHYDGTERAPRPHQGAAG